ncbi:dihydrofolate reductase family protein [Agromyces sp. MMS24-JH15]|uniref:dihydrofolate reductase family protein n=1 Tax=Agromyces sp. MMS24-JH15 TaxID=3243765 RepID=UPI003748DEE9
MGRLMISISATLDGYVADAAGNFDWVPITEEQHLFINDRLKGVGTYLFGRRLYETMRVWDDLPYDETSPATNEFAEYWRGTDKVVYSSTLESIELRRGRLERRFDPDAARALVEASDRDVEIGGPTLAAAALRAGIVDEISVYVLPVIVGGGTRLLPDGVRADLELVDEHRFANGTVYLSYRVRRDAPPPVA